MKRMLKRDEYTLAIDSRGKIENQYSKRLKHGTFGHSWVKEMSSQGRVKIVPWQHIDQGTRTKLIEAHFDSSAGEDFKYVVTASATESKVLVSHDPDYSPKVRSILRKRLKIKVCLARQLAKTGDAHE